MNNPFKVLKASLNKDSRRGFLLLEVIMSVFIVTIGVVVVIGSFVTSIRTYKISKAYSELHYLAEEKMWGYEEKGEIEEGGDSGDFDRHEGASWKIKAEELEDFPLNEVDLEITVKDDVSERKYQLATYLRNKEGLF
ncbi:MAG: hypothetical protein JW800_08370 [Candidatus Omnitrophica bacterium]|nr:hypothetical protein [Candidatus Omnitrophota bacterium]